MTRVSGGAGMFVPEIAPGIYGDSPGPSSKIFFVDIPNLRFADQPYLTTIQKVESTYTTD
jgi:hypothetical protein